MPPTEFEKRRLKMSQVLAAAQTFQEFTGQDLLPLCKDSKVPYINRLLKELISQQVLCLVREEEHAEPARYSWLVDRADFDAHGWVHHHLHSGHQIRQAPKEERPRERLLRQGAQRLMTGELLAILIRSGRQGESAVQAGQRIASRFESKLELLGEQSPSELKQISKVVSEVAFCQIMAGIELGKRVATARLASAPASRINSTQAAIDYCAHRFARLAQDAQQEEFHIVTLDTKLQPIQNHRITVGTLDASLVHPREVFRAAIRDSASSILLVHNHPSGDPTPSRQDQDVTRRLRESGELLGIRVIDHIIVARSESLSLLEHGDS